MVMKIILEVPSEQHVAMETEKEGGGRGQSFTRECPLPATSQTEPMSCVLKKAQISGCLWGWYTPELRTRWLAQIREDVWGDGLGYSPSGPASEKQLQSIFLERIQTSCTLRNIHNKIKISKHGIVFSSHSCLDSSSLIVTHKVV